MERKQSRSRTGPVLNVVKPVTGKKIVLRIVLEARVKILVGVSRIQGPKFRKIVLFHKIKNTIVHYIKGLQVAIVTVGHVQP